MAAVALQKAGPTARGIVVVRGFLAWFARGLGFVRASSSWRLQALAVYLVCELISYWRFRLRWARLSLPRRAYRRGTIEDLRWLQRSTEHPVCPVTFAKDSLQRYLNEEHATRGLSGPGPSVVWEHYYAAAREAFCMTDPSPQEHEVLVKIASAMCKKQNLPPPPKASRPPSMEAPIAFGCSPLQVFHKPLPIEVAFGGARLLADGVFLALGYRQRWLPTSEGWIRYWVTRPRDPDPSILPAVFIHGVGLGAVPYVHFLQRLRRARRATLIALEVPNCSRSHFQACVPSAASFRDAVERVVRDELGITAPGRYVLVGHSLGTDFCSMVMNDPRLAHGDPPVRPARLVLLDPVCFMQEIAEAHRLPFWTLQEAREKYGSLHWWPTILAVLLLVIRDEYNQEATKRAIVPGTDSIFRASNALLNRCPTLVCLSGNDAALPAWKIHDYLRAQFPQMEVRMDPGLEHGGFLMPLVPGWLARLHMETVLRFMDPVQLTRVASDPSSPDGLESVATPLRRSSRSELSLAKEKH